ncbi:MAG: hypothetical protein KAS32_31480 [Candidatus Peribacteraceae bacterium]|nr:hypothetical protein [Candidatus Peribacteraceae bacterium]
MESNEKVITLALAGVIAIILFATAFNVVSDYSKFKYGETIVIEEIEGDDIDYATFKIITIPPGAILFINDKSYMTPTAAIELDDGTYGYTITLDGYYAIESFVSLYSGLSKEITYPMEPAPEEYIQPDIPDPLSPDATTPPIINTVPVQFKFVSSVPGMKVSSGGYVQDTTLSTLSLVNSPLTIIQNSISHDTEVSTQIDLEKSGTVYYELESSYIVGETSKGSRIAPQSITTYEIPFVPKQYGFLLRIASKSDGTPTIADKHIPVAYEVQGTLIPGDLSPGDAKYNIYLSSTTSMASKPTYIIYDNMVDPGSFHSTYISITTIDLGPDSHVTGYKEIYIEIEEVPTGKTIKYRLPYRLTNTFISTSNIQQV